MFHPRAQSHPSNSIRFSLDEFLGFEKSSQIEHLPGGESKQATHAEYTEEEDSVVCRL